MASKVLKIRIVHCPRCWKLLSELPDIPFYKCGGCGAILQAKKHHGGRASSSASSTFQADSVLLDESGHEDGEQVTSSNQTITCSTDTDCANAPVESKDCGKSMSECRSNSSQISTSGELNCHDKDATAETGGEPDCVEGRSLDSEIPENSSQVASKGMQFDAISSSDELNSHGKKVIAETGANGIESDLNQLRSSNHESSEHSDHLASMGVNNTTVVAGQSEMNIQLEADKSYLNKEVEQPQRLGQCGSDYSTMEDEVDGTEECTNNNTKHGLLSKSPTTKSSHAYYGSVSSYGDDLDDHVPNHHLHLSERTLLKDQRSADSFNNKGWSVQESHSELESQARKFLPMSSNDNYGSITTGSDHRNQDEPSGGTGHGLHAQQQRLEDPDIFHSVRSWMESEMDVPSRSLSRDVSHRRELSNVYQNDSSSSYRNEELSRSVSSNSFASGKLQRLDQDRIELLTKVEELNNQLQRMYRHNEEMKGSFHGRVSQMENWRQPFSSYKPGQELLWNNNAMCHWTPGTYGPRKRMPHQYASSLMSSSEQSINCRHHFDYSCSHCCSQDCQYPPQLPPSISYKKVPCQACTGHICHHPNHLYSPSISSSSKKYVNSVHSARQHKQIEKLHIKEKHQSVKRHCRPMAGAAPFVVCYKCRKLLQLPADFLLSKRRHHKLQCGACSNVLVFSLHGSNRKSRSSPIRVQHLPSNVDHSTDTVTGRYFASSSHTADGYFQGDPLSYSDDYGRSISKSYSTEGEHPLLATPFHAPRGFALDKNSRASSSTNSKPMQEKNESVSKQVGDRSGPGNLRKAFGSAIPSSEATKSDKTSEATAEMTRGSPLHRLMGYSSASELLYSGSLYDAYALPNYHARCPTLLGSVTSSPVHEDSLPRTYRNSFEMREENDLLKRSRNNRDPALPKSMKKGSGESSHGLENVKLKASVNGKIVPQHQLGKRAAKKEPVQHVKYG